MAETIAARLARNVRHLREARGLTQQQMAKLSGVPRATWSHVESGAGNPTLAVLHRIALALQVPIEELTAAPREIGRLYRRAELPGETRGDAAVRSLLPDRLPGVLIERMEFPPGGRLSGVPHMPGTREYLTCERGEVLLAVGGTQFILGPGDVLVFKGDERHSYRNTGARPAVAYSVVLLAPVS
jgi:transcriptional regulator with XRE-family HTH domain